MKLASCDGVRDYVLDFCAGLNIDEGTAAYYLEQTRGDLKKAFILYKEDLAWETANPVGVLPLRDPVPVQD